MTIPDLNQFMLSNPLMSKQKYLAYLFFFLKHTHSSPKSIQNGWQLLNRLILQAITLNVAFSLTKQVDRQAVHTSALNPVALHDLIKNPKQVSLHKGIGATLLQIYSTDNFI